MWVSGDFYDKQKLQYLLFPEGMLYDKENGVVRTTRINYLFKSIAIESRVSAEMQKGNLLQDCLFGSSVGKTGFEPATPWSQTRCATGLRYFPIENVADSPTLKLKSGEGGIRTRGTE